MSIMRPPKLGPIVGHTTDRSCRLWIRAQCPAESGTGLAEDNRTLGVLTVLEIGGSPLPPEQRPIYYFRLHREYDRTGTFTLGVESSLEGGAPSPPLLPDTRYRVRLGTLTLDDPLANRQVLEDEDLAKRLPPRDFTFWAAEFEALPAEESEAVFTTSPASGDRVDQFSFIMGSCRYPGLPWQHKLSDRIFQPIQRQATAAEDTHRPRFVLLVGDQIYADQFGSRLPIGAADTYGEFHNRYHDAFGSIQMRRLLRTVPTYMILDDHEIEDNWCQDRIREPHKRLLFNLAICSYLSFQWSHSPRNYGLQLYYSFDYGGYPFFVLDARTQRYLNTDTTLDDNDLLGRPSLDPSEPSQLDVLLAWLREQQRAHGDAPKFIVSAGVFVPNPIWARADALDARKVESDSWPAFPTTRRVVLQGIIANRIQNVVFLSGDIHCSNVAAMNFSGPAAGIKAFSITSSALYWPFSLADGEPGQYVHDSTDPRTLDPFVVSDNPEVVMNYRAWNFVQENNFSRIEVDRMHSEIRVQVFGTDGELAKDWALGRPREAVLALTPW